MGWGGGKRYWPARYWVYVVVLPFHWVLLEIRIISTGKREMWQEVHEGLLLAIWLQKMKVKNEKETVCYINHIK